jgi:tRNA modification GTPase
VKASPGDTIAAIATPAGRGALGIVRVSGPEALAVAGRVFRGAGGDPSSFASHTVHFGRVVSAGDLVDTVLLTVLRAPRSYTGEDTVEASCHGGRIVLQRVLGAVISAGARPARPGEFTLRAFLNGRMDLAQAEAVQELIAAESALGARAAAEQLQGRLSSEINALRDELVAILAEIEAAIDFPDEEIGPADRSVLLERLGAVRERAAALVETFEDGRRVRDGVDVVIAGKPNVGKSSLLNALLDAERAIVTPEPGTTRDLLRESLVLQGVALTVVDTAGICTPRGAAETESVRRSRAALEQADLVLLVLDGSVALDGADFEIAERLRPVEGAGPRPFITVINKVDLPLHAAFDLLDKRFAGGAIVRTSALKRTGLDELKHAVIDAAWPSGLPSSDAALVTHVRHRDALVRAERALGETMRGLDEGRGLELTALDAREALDALGEIVGAVTTDEILDSIFSRFCIGK